MIFTELRFVLLLAACWCTFFAVPVRARHLVLAFWGCVFYLLFAPWVLALVLALTGVTYGAYRKRYAVAAGTLLVLCLAWFKLDAATRTLVMPGVMATPVVPLGLSFLAFELLHVLIERRRGGIGQVRLQELFAFALFFPARAAGPIKRFPAFIESVVSAKAGVDHVYAGGLRVLMGLAKKLLVAEVLAPSVGAMSHASTLAEAWIVVFSYTFYIFLDFSAYSDVAIGVSRMLGIRIPENFRYPYLAPNIRDFWDRWHITLSHWVRDYVFVPSGRRLFKTRLRPYPSLIAVLTYLLTFLVVGAWHGLTVGFLVWGLYHGVLLSAHHLYRTKLPRRLALHPWNRSAAAGIAGTAFTFFCVTVGWVPFMADWETAGRLLGLMFGVDG